MKENRGFRFVPALDLIKALIRSKSRHCSLRAQLCLSYHLIYVPWYLQTRALDGVAGAMLVIFHPASLINRVMHSFCQIKVFLSQNTRRRKLGYLSLYVFSSPILLRGKKLKDPEKNNIFTVLLGTCKHTRRF